MLQSSLLSILSALHTAPIILLFISVGIGSFVGKFRIGTFQLGGIAGSLLVAVVLSQLNISIEKSVGGVFFALFIYTVGFRSGPKLFASLGKKTLKELSLVIVLATSSLITIFILAHIFSLDKGTAAGITSGALTQSAMMGTATAALAKMHLPEAAVQVQQTHVAIGYAVTYIFGSIGAIIMCTTILPLVTRHSIRHDAQVALFNRIKGPVVDSEEKEAIPEIIIRVFQIDRKPKLQIKDIENKGVRIETILRNENTVAVDRNAELKMGDRVLLLGLKKPVQECGKELGPEDPDAKGALSVTLESRKITPTIRNLPTASWTNIVDELSGDNLASVWILEIQRNDEKLSIREAGEIKSSDVAVLYGIPTDLERICTKLGKPVPGNNQTNLVYQGIGIALGLLIGTVTVHPFGIPITLGSGGGAMLSGLIFGWWQGKHPALGGISEGTATFLIQYGLAAFVATIGLNTGSQALHTVHDHGLLIFILGCIITIVPMFITLLYGWFILRYHNVAVFAGALAGARSTNPAFGQVLQAAGNNVPSVPFAITYAFANVILTLLGPIIVALI